MSRSLVSARRGLVTPYTCLTVCLVILERLGLSALAANVCPPTALFYDPGNTCVFWINKKVSWMDAQTECLKIDSKLVMVVDKRKNDWLVDTFKSKYESGNMSVWIGLVYDETQSWSNGQNIDEFEFQPFAKYNDRKKGCVYLAVDRKWYVESCAGGQTFELFCEIDKVDKCRINNKNGGCEQICVPDGTHKYHCECRHGFLLQNNATCLDIDECVTNNGGCDTICNNTYGSWMCGCNEGYSIHGLDCVKLPSGREFIRTFAVALMILSIAVIPLTIAVRTIVITTASASRKMKKSISRRTRSHSVP